MAEKRQFCRIALYDAPMNAPASVCIPIRKSNHSSPGGIDPFIDLRFVPADAVAAELDLLRE